MRPSRGTQQTDELAQPMSFSLPLCGTGVALVLVQLLVAIPWLLAFNWDLVRARVLALPRRDRFSGRQDWSTWPAWGLLGPCALVAAAGAIVLPARLAWGFIRGREGLGM